MALCVPLVCLSGKSSSQQSYQANSIHVYTEQSLSPCAEAREAGTKVHNALIQLKPALMDGAKPGLMDVNCKADFPEFATLAKKKRSLPGWCWVLQEQWRVHRPRLRQKTAASCRLTSRPCGAA